MCIFAGTCEFKFAVRKGRGVDIAYGSCPHLSFGKEPSATMGNGEAALVALHL